MDNQIQKLEESIPTNDVKIIDLYNKIDNDLLDTQPQYQRKLVWKKQHKFAFIDTILRNFPFPEICIASSDIDVDRMVATEVVVDGQQRLTTIVDYIKGQGDFKLQNKIAKFSDLEPTQKKSFLNYKVSVRDLKDIDEKLIKEIFQRINSTEYSLNTVEKNNALYGDGEIAIFSKQLIDQNYTATEDETDIVITPAVKKQINDFFFERKIFSDNDLKRMYDFQYIILIISTILEGNYYSRSTKVDEYLERFNTSFPDYSIILETLKKSLTTISNLNLSEKSYWYNKANLFTLIIELSKLKVDSLNIEKLEVELLKLEDKVDLYFSAETEDDIKDITEDEKRYFEVARHGSHEKPAREHRAKVIKSILDSCLNTEQAKNEPLEKKNIDFLSSIGIDYAIMIPTETALNKNIMDAVSPVRKFLKDNNLHDYNTQEFGPDHKYKKECNFIEINGDERKSEISLYRSNGRGDYRIWFTDLKSFAEPNQKLAMINDEGVVKVLNLSTIDYTSIFQPAN